MDATEWTRLTRAAGNLAGQLAQVQAELVALTAEILETHGWAGDGVRSPEHWLQVYTGLSLTQARELVRVAERGEGLAPVTEMMAEGRLTLDQAALVAAHVPDDSVAEVAKLAEAVTVTQLRRVTSRYPFDREQPPHEEPRRKPEQVETTLTMGVRNGRFELRFSADPLQGALVEQAIREAKDALFTAGNAAATLADGFIEVASRSLAAVVSTSRRDQYRVQLHLSTDGSGWVGGGGHVPPVLMDRFTCDGAVRPVWLTEGVPVAVGRSQRIVPDRTRRLVEDRDQGCRFPGCAATGFLENHHIIPWSQGGPTDPQNLVSLCPHHHRTHHLGDFAISGDPSTPDGLEFTDRGGWVLGRVFEPPDPPIRPVPLRQVELGHRLDMGSVWFASAEPQHVMAGQYG
ncbi:HNH endonuclease [Propionibacteriaceae bacterium G1746]